VPGSAPISSSLRLGPNPGSKGLPHGNGRDRRGVAKPTGEDDHRRGCIRVGHSFGRGPRDVGHAAFLRSRAHPNERDSLAAAPRLVGVQTSRLNRSLPVKLRRRKEKTPREIAKALKIGRASVYPGAGSRLIRSAPPMAGQIAAERIESARVSAPGEVFRQPSITRKPDSPFNGRKLFWDTTAYRPTAVPFETY
jgi:hypothetical protein